MAVQTGHDSTLTIDGTLGQSLNSFSLSIDGEQVDVTTFSAARWEEIVASKRDISISVSGKYERADTRSIIALITEFIAGDEFPYIVTYTLAAIGQLQTIAGTVLVADWNLSADDGSAVEWTATLQNSGAPVFTNRTV